MYESVYEKDQARNIKFGVINTEIVFNIMGIVRSLTLGVTGQELNPKIINIKRSERG